MTEWHYAIDEQGNTYDMRALVEAAEQWAGAIAEAARQVLDALRDLFAPVFEALSAWLRENETTLRELYAMLLRRRPVHGIVRARNRRAFMTRL